jgi:endonuclease I
MKNFRCFQIISFFKNLILIFSVLVLVNSNCGEGDTAGADDNSTNTGTGTGTAAGSSTGSGSGVGTETGSGTGTPTGNPPTGDCTCSGNNSCGSYYDSINTTLNNEPFMGELKALIGNHTVIDYGALGDPGGPFEDLDRGVEGCGPTQMFLIYSESCGGSFNKEHSWPKSWWGGQESGAKYSDLFHLFPTNSSANSGRWHLPFCNISTLTNDDHCGVDWVNVSLTVGKGYCDNAGYNDDKFGFQPPAEYKGDFARSHFYMSVRYRGELGTATAEAQCGNLITDHTIGSSLVAWYEDMLRMWHENDPVGQKECDRNQKIFENWQGNRNPFIDHPEWVNKISDF